MLISCSNNESNKQIKNLPKELLQSTIPIFRKIPNDSLIHYTYKPENTDEINYETNFQTLEDFPNSWVGISKNALGYFIYHRGNGLADILTITNDSLKNGGYGESVDWSIREFKKLNNHKYYFGLGMDTTSLTYARCTIQILDLDTFYSIQSTRVYIVEEGEEKLLGEYTGLYVPHYKQHLFYHINEPNKKDPNAWIPTEEIDLEIFKKEKTLSPIHTTLPSD